MLCIQKAVRIQQGHGTGRCTLVEGQVDQAIREMISTATTTGNKKNGFIFISLLDPAEGGALSFNENSDPAVRTDISRASERTCSTSFMKTLTYGSKSFLLPFENGSISHGTWQGLYLCDWRDDWSEANASPFTLGITIMLSPSVQITKSTFMPPKRGAHSMVQTAARLLKSTETSTTNTSVSNPNGLCCVMVRHCSASMSYLENSNAGNDLESALSIIVPDTWSGKYFSHVYEGWDDCPGHCKNALVGGPCVVVPMDSNGKLLIEQTEDICLDEHRDDWGSGGRGISVTRFPDCFVSSETLNLQQKSFGVEINLQQSTAIQSKISSGLVIFKGPSSSCFIIAASGKTEEYIWESMVKQRRTSDDFLMKKWHGSRPNCANIGEIVRSVIFGGGRTRVMAVKDGNVWLPQGCSLYLMSTSEKGFQNSQISIQISWFGNQK